MTVSFLFIPVKLSMTIDQLATLFIKVFKKASNHAEMLKVCDLIIRSIFHFSKK